MCGLVPRLALRKLALAVCPRFSQNLRYLALRKLALLLPAHGFLKACVIQ